MNDRFRSSLAAGGILLGLGSVYGGICLRNRVDFEGASLTASSSNSIMSTLVASRDQDVDLPAPDYYDRMVGLLKEYYVEPISDDQKLASGAVRGMISSLGDPRSMYMDPRQFRAFVDRQKGAYQGIGADFYLEMGGAKVKSSSAGAEPPPETTEEAVARLLRVPRLIVGAVVPGGPADAAGLRPGDVIAGIDNHWVVDQGLLDRFKNAQKLFNERKISFSEIAPLQNDLRDKMQRALLPVRAADRLQTGISGDLTVTWTRNGQSRTAHIAKGRCQMPGFSASGGAIRLPMTDSAVDDLKAAIKGKSQVTIDLRNDPEGSYQAAVKCLQILAPSGTYGVFVTDRQETPSPLMVTDGNRRPPKITLLVDRTTRGPAEILALALSSHGKAVLKGSEPSGDRAVLQTVQLGDGSGYSLVTSEYQATHEGKALVARRSR